MSIDALALALAASLLLASASGAAPLQPTPAKGVAPPSVAHEPLFADIVRRAAALKAETQSYESGPLDHGFDGPGFAAFQADIGALAALDMKGHVTLVQRGVNDDLKCILKGMSQDLPVKLKAMETADNARTRHAALEDMFYLLRDNVAVITAPPQPSA